MRATVLLLAFLTLPACAVQLPDNGTPAATCDELADQFDTAAAALDRSCQTVADCALVGGQREDTCDCTPTLGDRAVNRAGYQGSEAADLADRFFDQCADDPDAPAICDAAPPDVACSNNVCVYSLNSCLDFVDSGV